MEIIKINDLKNYNFKKNVFDYSEYITSVTKIISEVKNNGDNALINFTKKFDNTIIENIEVTNKEIETAFNLTSEKLKNNIKQIITNIKNYQKKTLSKSWITVENDLTKLGELVNPLSSVGLYVPGGTAPLISTVLMSAVPAKIAGVKNIYVCTPPDKNGKVNPTILAACKLCGVTKIFKVGGAHSIAALAYGTETIPKVEKIVGPGNIYVTIAKKMVYGDVNIDMIAGPSEILVYADESADYDFVIADLLSQAEHDVLASSFLVTTSEKLADHVKNNIYIQAAKLSRFEIIKKALDDNFKIFIAENNDISIKIINEIAPEHLELCISNPENIISKIKNAGAIFVGNYTPEAVGDYYAGPSHILPTNGTSKFYSPVSADTFIKKTSLISYSKDKFMKYAENIVEIAELESLTAHSNSVKLRIKNGR